MYVIDCGTNKSTIYDSETDNCRVITHEELLELPNKLPEGSLVVSEYSHLGCERTRFSRSQPFTARELLNLYYDFEQNNIKLKLFPQKSTPRACSYSGLEKSDLNDPKSIYLLLKDFPEISLMNPPETFSLSKIREESYEYKKYTSAYINAARRGDNPYTEDECSKFIRDNIETFAGSLSETAKSVFGLSNDCRYKKNGKINFNKVKMQAIYAVVCTLLDDEGNIRVRPSTGEIAGWQYIKRYVLCMTPFHFRGGVARSNLYYHGLKNWVIKQVKENHGFNLKGRSRGGFFEKDGKTKKPDSQFTAEEDRLYRVYRKQYCDSIRELWQLTKRILTGTQDSCHHSKQLEFKLSS